MRSWSLVAARDGELFEACDTFADRAVAEIWALETLIKRFALEDVSDLEDAWAETDGGRLREVRWDGLNARAIDLLDASNALRRSIADVAIRDTSEWARVVVCELA